MRRLGRLTSAYLIRTILPYFFFSWLLLSVVLFIQQAARFSDIFFSISVPAGLVWQLMIALVPNVIAFTCPMAVLVGTVIGLSKMQGDSELVAMRAAGLGNKQILVPMIGLGLVLSAFAFLVNLEGVPFAAKLVRQVALKTAIQKLESPIEPGVFNTEIPGYTIYVKSGDPQTGRWQNIFVYQEDPSAGTSRYVTSKEGRIDVSDQISELVLENAIVTTLPLIGREGKYVTENLGDIRIAIRTRRNELIDRLGRVQLSPEELGLAELSEYASAREGKDRVEAQILWQRRILLSVTPLIFCVLGSAMVLRSRRGGRGFGAILALLGLVVYYLVAFFGEQLARIGAVSVPVAGLLPVIAAATLIVWLNLSRKYDLFRRLYDHGSAVWSRLHQASDRVQLRNVFVDLTTGIRDLDILASLAKYFLLTLAFIGSLSLVFTAFELWRFAGVMENGVYLLVKYLVFLIPFIYMQYLAPTAVMLAILATYVIKSRQNEIVTWISAGLSVYRLLLPCILAAAALGVVNWQIQERVLPITNRIQDDLRSFIRSKGAMVRGNGRYWETVNGKIITFQPPASDNDQQLLDLSVIDLSDKDARLQHLYRSEKAIWIDGSLRLEDPAESVTISNGEVERKYFRNTSIEMSGDPSIDALEKPSNLDRELIKRRLDESDSETEKRIYGVALEKRNATPFLPLIIALFSSPFALTLGRRGRVAAIGGAIGIWLLFIGSTSVFEQFGLNGSLTPVFAVWPPLVVFTALGVYLLGRVRT